MNASDDVIWAITRKQNAFTRGHVTYGVRPFFTKERHNVTNMDKYKTSGYRQHTVSIGTDKIEPIEDESSDEDEEQEPKDKEEEEEEVEYK